MSIESNAAPSELDSPYFAANERLCKRWENYIFKKNGKIKGFYNAWSFILKSLVKGRKEWLIDVKKATFSNGHILFSSKRQNLQEILTFQSIFKNTGCDDFCISRSFFKRKKRDHPFYKKVEQLLEEAIKDKSLYEAKYRGSKLIIVIHYKNDWFEMADKILDFDFGE